MSEGPYTKQEQKPAASEVSEEAPGVLRMQLPVDMPGIGHVNCYALLDDRGAALVDPGLPGEASWDALQDRLRQAGIPLERVHTALVTHSHPDHYGASHQLREQAGAAIIAHSDFTSTPFAVAANDDIDLDLLDLSPEELVELWKAKMHDRGTTPWGTSRRPPPDEVIRLWIQMNGVGEALRFRVPSPTGRLADGETLRLAGRDWLAVHTPGHTVDHLCLWDPAEGVLLSGDHVMPTITPHVGGTAEMDDPLAAFLSSLERVARFEGLRVCLPAHGDPFRDVRGRAEAISRHHADRLDELRGTGADLIDAPVESFMRTLFSERAWGDLAASETYAHLEHLRLAGEAEARRDSQGLLRYRLNAPDSS